MLREKKNRGFSLIELVVAIAVSTVIAAGVGAAMVLGMKNYSRANAEATLQESAQIVMNILQDLIVDTTRSPDIGYETDESGKSNVLSMYYAETKTISQVIFTPADEEGKAGKLLYRTIDKSKKEPVTNEEVLSTKVTSFLCDYSPANDDMLTARKEAEAMTIELTMQEGQGSQERSFHTTKTIAMRNCHAKDFDEEMSLWGEDGAESGEEGGESADSVKLIVSTLEFYTAPGSTLQLTGVSVSAPNGESTKVQYQFDENAVKGNTRWKNSGKTGGWVDDNTLIIGEDETAEQFIVNVRPEAAPETVKKIYVHISRVTLVLDSPTITAEPGMTIRITGARVRAASGSAANKELEYCIDRNNSGPNAGIKDGTQLTAVGKNSNWTTDNELKIEGGERLKRIALKIRPKADPAQIKTIYVYNRRVNKLTLNDPKISGDGRVIPGNVIELSTTLDYNPGAADTDADTEKLKALNWVCKIRDKDVSDKGYYSTTDEGKLLLTIPEGYETNTKIEITVTANHPEKGGGMSARKDSSGENISYSYDQVNTLNGINGTTYTFYMDSFVFSAGVKDLGVIPIARGQKTVSLPADKLGNPTGKLTVLYRKAMDRWTYYDKNKMYAISDYTSGYSSDKNRYSGYLSYENKKGFSWEKLTPALLKDLTADTGYGWRELSISGDQLTLSQDGMFANAAEEGTKNADNKQANFWTAETSDGKQYSGGANQRRDTKFEIVVIETTAGGSAGEGTSGSGASGETCSLIARGELLVPGVRLYLSGLPEEGLHLFELAGDSAQSLLPKNGNKLTISQEAGYPAFSRLALLQGESYTAASKESDTGTVILQARYDGSGSNKKRNAYRPLTTGSVSESGEKLSLNFSMPDYIRKGGGSEDSWDEPVSFPTTLKSGRGDLSNASNLRDREVRIYQVYPVVYYPYGDAAKFQARRYAYDVFPPMYEFSQKDAMQDTDVFNANPDTDNLFFRVFMYVGNIKVKSMEDNNKYDTAYLPPPGSSEDVLNQYSLKELTSIYRPEHTYQAIYLKTRHYVDQNGGDTYDPYLIRMKVVDGVRYVHLWRPDMTTIRYYSDSGERRGFSAQAGKDLGEYYYDTAREIWVPK